MAELEEINSEGGLVALKVKSVIETDLSIVLENTKYESANGPEFEGMHMTVGPGGLVTGIIMPPQHWTWIGTNVNDIELSTTPVNILALSADQDLLNADSSFQFSGKLENYNTFSGDITAIFRMSVGGVEVDKREVTRERGQSIEFVFNGPIITTIPSGDLIEVTAELTSNSNGRLKGSELVTKLQLNKAQGAVAQAKATVDGYDINTNTPTDPKIPVARIGDSGGHVRLTSEGVRLKDTAMMYDDLSFNVFGQRLYSAVGRVDFDWDRNTVVFQNSGSLASSADRVQANEPYNHKFKSSVNASDLITMYPHFHWLQFNANDQYTLSAEFRILNNGVGVSDTDWMLLEATTANGNDVFAFDLAGKDYMPQITEFAPIAAYLGLSAEVQIRVARTDANTFTDDLHITQLDAHCPIDSLGSEDPLTKEIY